MPPSPLMLHRTELQPDWIDYNGHLNEAYYLLIFSHATDALIDHIGMDAAFRDRHSCSIYTLETHLCYLGEVKPEATVSVETRLLDLDAKRVHLVRDHDKTVACTAEMVMAHVDMSGPRISPFAPSVFAELERIAGEQDGLPWPERAGRSIGLKKR